MPVFVYRAADGQGRILDGVMEASGPGAVVERLHRERRFPLEIVSERGRRGWRPTRGVGRITHRDLAAFTEELATLVEAGLPLDRALAILGELSTRSRLKRVVDDLLQSVRSGASLSEALGRHTPRPFSRLYVNMVRAGERSGVLDGALRKLAEFEESARALRDALASALVYPVLLTSVGGAAVVFLLTFVLPRFAEVFGDLGQALPWPTQVLLIASRGLARYWWVLVLAAASGLLGIRVVLATRPGRLAWDRVCLRLPLVGPLITELEVSRYTRTAGTLLQGGVPVLVALEVAHDVLGNQRLAQASAHVREGVARGTPLSLPMAQSGAFPGLAVHLVRVGEETGRLEAMLLRVADTFEAHVKSAVTRLVGLLEPAIVLTMGLVVGFIVVAVLLAIFSLNELAL